jgi:hypothetical protein
MAYQQFFRYATLGLLLLIGSACADYPAPPQAHSLDYLEIHDPGGWTLRIDGDEGGRLRWRNLPGRWAVYLPATFRLRQAARRIADCHQPISFTSSSCLRAVYYRQNSNETQVCHCPDPDWVKGFFDLAFTELRRSAGSKKDRRLLYRAWLSNPPRATLESE